MKISTILTSLSTLIVSTKAADCWSLPAYQCCEKNVIVYTDESGDWGVENNQWCGIVKSSVKRICKSYPQYPCCEGNEVVYTDEQGKWGIENNRWCGIIEEIKELELPTGIEEPTGNEEPIEDDGLYTAVQLKAAPSFSIEAGFYEEKDDLEVTLESNEEIYYTLDSSDPTTSETAMKYNGTAIRLYDRSVDDNVYSMHQFEKNSPYSVTLQTQYIASEKKHDKVNVLRAVAKLADGSFSPIITKTYVVMNKEKLDFYSELPLVSLVTDPSNLYDKDKGIYVCGQQYVDWKNSPEGKGFKSEWDMDNVANFFSRGKEWERPASFALLSDGKEQFIQDIGIRIKGASTRNSQTKSFNVNARSKYGKSKIKYTLFEDNKSAIDNEVIDKYDSFGIRSNGWIDKLRDAIVQQGLKDYPTVATFENKKCTLFLDGEFWGMYDLVEKASDYYIQTKYGIPRDDVAIVKNDELEAGSDADLEELQDLVEFCKTADLRVKADYEKVASKVDLESLIFDYAASFYIGIWDWPDRNYLFYRNNGEPIEGNPYSDGKWRMGMFDFDYSIGLTYASYGGVKGYAYDSFKSFFSKRSKFPAPIFDALMYTKEFRDEFAKVVLTMGKTVFEADKMRAVVEKQKELVKYMIATDWRWHSGTPKYDYDYFTETQTEYFTSALNDMIEFFDNRNEYVEKFLETFLKEYE